MADCGGGLQLPWIVQNLACALQGKALQGPLCQEVVVTPEPVSDLM